MKRILKSHDSYHIKHNNQDGYYHTNHNDQDGYYHHKHQDGYDGYHYWVIQQKSNRWFLGTDNKFSSYYPMAANIQKFDYNGAVVEVSNLHLTLNQVNILRIRPSNINIHNMIRQRIPKGKK